MAEAGAGHERRKADHIRINLEENVQFPRLTTGLEQVQFAHQALPELNLLIGAFIMISPAPMKFGPRAPEALPSMSPPVRNSSVPESQPIRGEALLVTSPV